MLNQDFVNELNKICEYTEKDGYALIKGDDVIVSQLETIYDLAKQYESVVGVNFKGCSVETITEAIKYALAREDLSDPIMILNILNLIKIYNTLDDSFFENEDVYVSNIEELLDVKLALKDDLKKFIKQLSIYFISLFKSYNKTSYAPLDVHIDLPKIYETIILASDLLTLSGIFSISEPFNTNECVYINNNFKYIETLLMKNAISTSFFNAFLEEQNGDSNE